jgi:hypothetical protein
MRVKTYHTEAGAPDLGTIQGRLAYVRARSGTDSLREFHDRLLEGLSAQEKKRFKSYEAARTYHREKNPRPAPTPYLKRVAQEFGYLFEWLATGEGPKTPEDEMALASEHEPRGEHSAAADAMETGIATLREMLPLVDWGASEVRMLLRRIYVRHFFQTYVNTEGGRESQRADQGALEQAAFDCALQVANAYDGPLKELGLLQRTWDRAEVDGYYMSLSLALLAVLPKDRLSPAAQSWQANLRKEDRDG